MKRIFKMSRAARQGFVSAFHLSSGQEQKKVIPEDPWKSDMRAMKSDWDTVGRDMKDVLGQK